MSAISQIYGRQMGLDVLPNWFGQLKNLKYVTLDLNKIWIVYEGHLPSSLKQLDMYDNKLISIYVSNLTHLTTLNLGRNKLSTIDLTKLSSLK